MVPRCGVGTCLRTRCALSRPRRVAGAPRDEASEGGGANGGTIRMLCSVGPARGLRLQAGPRAERSQAAFAGREARCGAVAGGEPGLWAPVHALCGTREGEREDSTLRCDSKDSRRSGLTCAG